MPICARAASRLAMASAMRGSIVVFFRIGSSMRRSVRNETRREDTQSLAAA